MKLNLKEAFNQSLNRGDVQLQSTHLLAVSGGLDSMVMLHLAVASGLNIAVAHVNYGLRGADSDADQSLVESSCQNLGVVLHAIKANLEIRESSSVQTAARDYRYHWFESLCKEFGYADLFTAHHRDDRVETFFINLLRGAGIAGLRAIPYRNGHIIRPLLQCTKAQLLAYAETHGLAWREDQSNASDAYLRNQIRHKLIPVLQDLNPEAIERINLSIDHLALADQYFENEIRELLSEDFPKHESAIHFSFERWNDLIRKAPLDHYLLRKLDFTVVEITAIRTLMDSQVGKRILGKKYTAIRERNGLVFQVNQEHLDQHFSVTSVFGSVEWQNQVISWQKVAWPQSELDETSVYFDADKLQFPLQLRNWFAGDRMNPVGMTGSKKVSDILTDAKVAAHEKKQVLVFESDGKIVWLIGYRLDRNYICTDQTVKAWEFKIEPLTTKLVKSTYK